MITVAEQDRLGKMFPFGAPAVRYLEEVLRFEVVYSRDVYHALCSFAYDHKWEIKRWHPHNSDDMSGRWIMVMARKSDVIEFEVPEGRPIHGYQPHPGPVNFQPPPTKP